MSHITAGKHRDRKEHMSTWPQAALRLRPATSLPLNHLCSVLGLQSDSESSVAVHSDWGHRGLLKVRAALLCRENTLLRSLSLAHINMPRIVT